MPSWIALGTTTIASVHERVLSIPLLILSGAVPLVSPLVLLLVVPFGWIAWAVKHVGVVLQAVFLLQSILFDSVGDSLNSFASSSPTKPSNPALLQTRLANLSTTVYPQMLSSLWGNSFEPLESTPDSPVQLTEKDLQEWEQAGTRLKRDVEEGIDETVSLWVQILENPSKEYLEAVQDELERIQAGRPTTYLYTLADDLDLSEKAQEIERLDVEAKMEQEAKLDVKFEAFLDQMAMPPEARATLDNPSNPADPRSPTFRQLLRTSWEDMYGSKGVLGGLENEFDALNNFDLGMGRSLEPDQNIDDILASPDYKPGRIPLMTIHLLRDQLRARIDSLSTSSSSNLLPPEDPLDVQILPKISRSVSDDYLNFFQRSVQIDLRARRLVQRVLSILYRIPAPPDSATDAGRALISPSMLLASPADFPHFVKKLDWTLTRCSERFLSAHRFALVAFQPETGLVAIKRLEREILAAEEAAAQGAKHSGDEL